MITENTENLDGDDVISQEQKGLDSEQGIQAPAQPLTEEQVRQIVQQQTEQIQRQVSGIQGLTDRGLDAIRRDLVADTDRKIAAMQAGRGREQLLASLDDDERERTQAVFNVIDAERQAREPTPASQPAPQAAAPATDPMEPARRYVEMTGLQRNNPNVNYTILEDATLNDQQREAKFVANVAAAGRQQVTVATAAPAQQAATNDVQLPPVDVGQGISPQSQAEEDIEADFISDKITESVYRERMAPFRAV